MALATNDTEESVREEVAVDSYRNKSAFSSPASGPPNCRVSMKNASGSDTIALEVTGASWDYRQVSFSAYEPNGTYVDIQRGNYRLENGRTLLFRGESPSGGGRCTATVRGAFVVGGQRRDDVPWEWSIDVPDAYLKKDGATITGSCAGRPANAPLLTVGEHLICEAKVTKQGNPAEAQVTIGVTK